MICSAFPIRLNTLSHFFLSQYFVINIGLSLQDSFGPVAALKSFMLYSCVISKRCIAIFFFVLLLLYKTHHFGFFTFLQNIYLPSLSSPHLCHNVKRGFRAGDGQPIRSTLFVCGFSMLLYFGSQLEFVVSLCVSKLHVGTKLSLRQFVNTV